MGAIPMQYAIMQPAERYLLFLTDYQGVAPADPAGKKRHLVTGVWSGLFLFENGRMRVNPSRPDALRQAYEGLTVEQVAKQIQDLQKP